MNFIIFYAPQIFFGLIGFIVIMEIVGVLIRWFTRHKYGKYSIR